MAKENQGTCILPGEISWELLGLVTKAILDDHPAFSEDSLIPPKVKGGAGPWKGLASLGQAGPEHLSFLEDVRHHQDQAKLTRAGACLVQAAHRHLLPSHTLALVTETPYGDFIKIATHIEAENTPPWKPGIHPSAIVDSTAVVPSSCRVEAGVVVGPNVRLGERCWLGACTVLGEGVSLGDHCHIESHVTLVSTCMGHHGYIKAGARIGQRGFGFIPDFSSPSHWITVPHVGRVIMGDYVEIGANTTIDRGSFQDTCIGSFTRIDNLVQIGHNVCVGEHVVMAGQCGIAGSSRIGDFCMLGGGVGVADHVTLALKIKVGARSGVAKSCHEVGEVLMGTPAVPARQWWRQVVMWKRLSASPLFSFEQEK